MIWTCIEILDCRLCLNFKKFSKTTDHKISCKDMGSQEGRSSFAKYGEMSVTVAVFCYSQAELMWHDYICNRLLLCEM